MTDKDLMRRIMYLKEWNQTRLAQALGFNQSNISRIIHEMQGSTLMIDIAQKHNLQLRVYDSI